MPETPDPNHTHPTYDANFSRILNILEQLAVVMRDHVEQSKINEARHEAAHARIDAALERLTLTSAENEDKLNGLITLMDRHIREHDQQ